MYLLFLSFRFMTCLTAGLASGPWSANVKEGSDYCWLWTEGQVTSAACQVELDWSQGCRVTSLISEMSWTTPSNGAAARLVKASGFASWAKASGNSSNLSGVERVGIPCGERAHPGPDETDSSSTSCQTTRPPWLHKENDEWVTSLGNPDRKQRHTTAHTLLSFCLSATNTINNFSTKL